MKLLNSLGTFALLALMMGISHGAIVAPRQVATMAQEANLIVVAAAKATLQPTLVQSVELEIERVVKGDQVLLGRTIAVGWNRVTGQILEPSGIINAYGLWFLKASSSGWEIIPATSGNILFPMLSFPLPKGPLPIEYSYGPAASASDRLAAELAAAIEGGTLHKFQLVSLLTGELDELHSPVVDLMYRRLSDSVLPPKRALGLGGLIHAGESAALSAASETSVEFARYPFENGIVLSIIRDRLRSHDPAVIAVLGQSVLDQRVDLAFRESAAHALAAIHTAATLPYLATLLEDANGSLRIEAIGGIGAFANGLPSHSPDIPSMPYMQLPSNSPYQSTETIANFAMGKIAISRNESAYLGFWRDWWRQQRAGLGF